MTSTCLSLLFAAATTFSFVRPSSHSDYTRFHPLATELISPIDAPVWTAEGTASGLSLAVPLPGGKVLLGYATQQPVGSNAFARVPTTTELVLHDAGSGSALWRTSVWLSSTVSLLAAEPLLVLSDDRGVRAVDPATGAVVWKIDQPGTLGALSPDRKVAVFLKKAPKASSTGVQAVRLDDGTVAWSATVPAATEALSLAVQALADRILVVGRSVVVYDLASGEQLAAEAGGPELEPPVQTQVVAGGILVGDARGLVARLAADASVVWKAEVGEKVGFVAARDDQVVVVSSADARARIRLLSLGTGAERWAHEDSLPATAPRFGPSSVTYTTYDRLVVLERSTGRELGSAPRARSLQASTLPDRLVFSPDQRQVTIVGETGLQAIRLQAGRPAGELWHLDLRGVEFSTLEARQCFGPGQYPDLKLSTARRTVATPETASAGDPSAVPALPPAVATPAYQNLSLSHAGEDYFRAQADDRTRTATEQYTSARMAVGMSQARVQMEYSLTVLASGLNLAGGAFSAMARSMNEHARAQNVRTVSGMRSAVDLWSLSVQGDFFVRPLAWYFGEGVLLVDLRTGRWREIVTGPAEPVLGSHYLGSPPALFDPGLRRVFTVARTEKPTSVAEFPNITVGAQAGAAFEVPPPESWSRPEDYAARSRAPPSFEELLSTE